MSVICPTVLADTVDEYREQVEAISRFATRIQIDLGDGRFTTKTVDVSDVWWPDTVMADIHLMYEEPMAALTTLLELKPDMIIVHAEAKDAQEAIESIQQRGIRAGVALLQDTTVESAHELIRLCDHALIFSGSLGSFGGRVDFSQLSKVKQIRGVKLDIEIGWDGGINADTIKALSDGGIDVLNVGGAIQKANHPENAYRGLRRQLYD